MSPLLTFCGRERHVVLKLFVTSSSSLGKHLDDEINVYERMKRASTRHPGAAAVRSHLDTFNVGRPAGDHRCLVHHPLGESTIALLHRNPVARLPIPVIAFTLRRSFLALDFLHSECQIIHTDIKGDNILFGVEDPSVFEHFERQGLDEPSPGKVHDDHTVYLSRDLRLPKQWGAPVLCDFGSALLGDTKHTDDIQPDIYRAPEVILEVPWSCEVDIWNVGCMIWDLFDGGHLFVGKDPHEGVYRSRAHLAEMIALLGPPPADLLSQGRASNKFITESGSSRHEDLVGPTIPLEQRETTLANANAEDNDRDLFLRFMRKMLQWHPAKRHSARDLAEDEWIRRHSHT